MLVGANRLSLPCLRLYFTMSTISATTTAATTLFPQTPMMSEPSTEYFSPKGYRAEFTEERSVPTTLNVELERLMKLPTQKGKRIIKMIEQFALFP